MKAKEYDVLEMAVEIGVNWGWSRAHKHLDNPDEHQIKKHMNREVLNAVCEWFDFEEPCDD